MTGWPWTCRLISDVPTWKNCQFSLPHAPRALTPVITLLQGCGETVPSLKIPQAFWCWLKGFTELFSSEIIEAELMLCLAVICAVHGKVLLSQWPNSNLMALMSTFKLSCWGLREAKLLLIVANRGLQSGAVFNPSHEGSSLWLLSGQGQVGSWLVWTPPPSQSWLGRKCPPASALWLVAWQWDHEHPLEQP